MRFFYGERNILRALEEADFWKKQESEHVDVILEIVPDLEEEYIQKLEEYQEIFNSTHGRIVQLVETAVNCHNILSPELQRDIINIINLAVRQSQVFIDFIGLLLRDSKAVTNNPTAIIVLNHIRRESEYFVGIVTAFLNSSCANNGRYYNDMGFQRK